MINQVIFAAVAPVSQAQEDLITLAKHSPWVTLPLVLTGLAVLAILLLWLRRLPSDLRARKSPTLDPSQLEDLMLGNPPQIIDLREDRAFKGEHGHIRGAMNIPYRELKARLHELHTSHPRPIVLVDETDILSHRALPLVKNEGHRWVYVLKGGLRAWRRRKMPVYKTGRR